LAEAVKGIEMGRGEEYEDVNGLLNCVEATSWKQRSSRERRNETSYTDSRGSFATQR